MTPEPTLDEVIDVLETLEQMMDAAEDRLSLLKLSTVYATAYSYKLKLMSKEAPRARH